MPSSRPIIHAAYQMLLLFGLVMLGACTAVQPESGVAATQAWQPPANATRFAIDPALSELEIRVFRAGPLSSFGHNHVIEIPVVGSVYRAEPLQRSGFRLSIPVRDAIIDRPAARTGAGEDFSSEVSSAARKGTRDNMLGEDLLHAARYPDVIIESMSIAGTAPDLTLRLRIILRGRAFERTVGARLTEVDDRIHVNSHFTMTQTELGLTQYSTLGGGLKVRDEMEFRLHIETKSPEAGP